MDPLKQVVTTISSVQVKEGDEGRLLLVDQDEGHTSSMTGSYDDEDLIPLDSEITCKVGHVKLVVSESCKWHRSALRRNMHV